MYANAMDTLMHRPSSFCSTGCAACAVGIHEKGSTILICVLFDPILLSQKFLQVQGTLTTLYRTIRIILLLFRCPLSLYGYIAPTLFNTFLAIGRSRLLFLLSVWFPRKKDRKKNDNWPFSWFRHNTITYAWTFLVWIDKDNLLQITNITVINFTWFSPALRFLGIRSVLHIHVCVFGPSLLIHAKREHVVERLNFSLWKGNLSWFNFQSLAINHKVIHPPTNFCTFLATLYTCSSHLPGSKVRLASPEWDGLWSVVRCSQFLTRKSTLDRQKV